MPQYAARFRLVAILKQTFVNTFGLKRIKLPKHKNKNSRKPDGF